MKTLIMGGMLLLCSCFPSKKTIIDDARSIKALDLLTEEYMQKTNNFVADRDLDSAQFYLNGVMYFYQKEEKLKSKYRKLNQKKLKRKLDKINRDANKN